MNERCGFRFKSRGSRFNAHREVEADTTERAATVRLRWEEVKIQACFDDFEVVKAEQSRAEQGEGEEVSNQECRDGMNE